MIGRSLVVAVLAVLGAVVFACGDDGGEPVAGGNASAGRAAVEAYGCGSCHGIPGVGGADGEVAVTLDGFAERDFIVGVLPNTAENLIQFLLNPQSVIEEIAMPDLGLTETDARNIAEHLYTLD